MCGIMGGLGDQVHEFVHSNLNLLEKRGPDSQGVLNIENGLVFGATRLAMTDPHPRSNQPMIDKHSNNVLIFNGEIFNFKLIRNQLKSESISFETESDTEVLLKALTYYGVEIISKLQGMFAFVFFDRKQNRLILARDYLGKKPLFYHYTDKGIFFASQVEIVAKYNNSTLCHEALATYLQLGYLIEPKTMYRNIYSVKPGEIVTINLTPEISFDSSSYSPQIFQEANSGDISTEIQKSLQARTAGHSNFALSLSGGVDSTILAVESMRLGLQFSAFSMSWPGTDKVKYNEDSRSAYKVSKILGIKLNIVEMPKFSNLPNLIDEFVVAMGEPNSNPTGISMMVLYSKISMSGHRLTLTGDGSDEIFGGYPRYAMAAKIQKLPKFNSHVLKNIIRNGSLKNNLLSKVAVAFTKKNTPESWLYWHLICGNDFLDKLIPDIYPANLFPSGLELKNIFYDNLVSSLTYRDLKTWLSMESNKRLDRISMHYSIEARSPFQDENVIQSGYSHMSREKFKINQKQLLRIEYPILQTLPLNSQKIGFISPLGYWLRNNQALINDTITELPKYAPFNTRTLSMLAKSPNNGDYAKMKILWSLIVLNSWFRNNKSLISY
jgi:asparagine synthase (glutamine-hydrolysing)